MPNIRPAYLYEELKDACPLRTRSIAEAGFDMVIMRELTGGLYFGEERQKKSTACERPRIRWYMMKMRFASIAVKGFEIARKREETCDQRG